MIIISEYKISDEQIKEYHDKGIRFAYGNQTPEIHRGEAVGILLDTMYKSTIDLIEKLLFTKHNVTLKYNDKSYKLATLEEWKNTTQNDKDMLKLETYKHPILKIYLEKRKEYFDKIKNEKRNKRFEDLLIEYNVDQIPDEDEMNNLLAAFAPLYQIDIAQDRFEKMQQYFQVQYYLDNDIPYVDEVKGIKPEDELMFEGIKFKTFYEEPIEIESFGNEIYLEDYIYSNSKTIA